MKINFNTIIKYLQIISYYLLILLGFSMVSWVIWARFIRERLPKDIPFITSEIGFYILLYVCIIYIFVVKNLIKPSTFTFGRIYLLKIISIIYKPLFTFDVFIKTNKYIYTYYYNLLLSSIQFLDKLRYKHFTLIYVMFLILPRFILVICLLLDTFYFHKLELIYKFILIGILPLIHTYLKYSLNLAKEQFILHLESKYKYVCLDYEEEEEEEDEYEGWIYLDGIPRDPKPVSDAIYAIHKDKMVTIREYIEIQTEASAEHALTYEIFIVFHGSYAKELNPNDYDRTDKEFKAIIDKEFHDKMPILLKLNLFLYFYNLRDTDIILRELELKILENVRLKDSLIIVYGLYFICWAYILYKSLDQVEAFTFSVKLFRWLLTIVDNEEPFSILNIYDDEI